MRARDSLSLIAICAALCSVVLLIFLALAEARAQQLPRNASEGGPYKDDLQLQKAPARIFNTAKQKVREGKMLVGATVFSPDPNIYCAVANAGYDYTWIEMQHSQIGRASCRERV